MPDTEINVRTSPSAENFFAKLSKGNLGLAKTYWLCGVLVGIVANLISRTITSVSILAAFTVAYMAWECMVLIGTWRAAGKYKGPAVWAVLARTAVVIGAIGLLLTFLLIIRLLGKA